MGVTCFCIKNTSYICVCYCRLENNIKMLISIGTGLCIGPKGPLAPYCLILYLLFVLHIMFYVSFSINKPNYKSNKN